jgi:hypothetical protein
MSNLIVPGGKIVLTPEKEYEAYYGDLERTRDALFVGAIMHLADEIHESGEFKDYRDSKERAHQSSDTLVAELMCLLDLAIERKWNVAVEMLNWRKRRIAKNIEEKVRGEGPSCSEEVI